MGNFRMFQSKPSRIHKNPLKNAIIVPPCHVAGILTQIIRGHLAELRELDAICLAISNEKKVPLNHGYQCLFHRFYGCSRFQRS